MKISFREGRKKEVEHRDVRKRGSGEKKSDSPITGGGAYFLVLIGKISFQEEHAEFISIYSRRGGVKRDYHRHEEMGWADGRLS